MSQLGGTVFDTIWGGVTGAVQGAYEGTKRAANAAGNLAVQGYNRVVGVGSAPAAETPAPTMGGRRRKNKKNATKKAGRRSRSRSRRS